MFMYTRIEDEARYLQKCRCEERTLASREYIGRLSSDPIYGSHRNRFLNWLQMTVDGPNYKSTYVAVAYYDRFLSATPAHHDFPLLCLTCYREAVMLFEGRMPTVTAIFGVEFTSSQIFHAGLSLRDALNYELLLQTPFTYLSYFCLKMYDSSYLPEAIDHVMESIAATALLYYEPSLIAAAAVMAAHTTIKHSIISREDVKEKLRTVNEVGIGDFSAGAPVFSCYLRMMNWRRNRRDTID